MTIESGHVEVRLGANFTDQAEFDKWDRALEKAERRKKVEAELGADFDDRQFQEFERALDRAEARAKRRSAYKASLGADFDARAFNSAERALSQYERNAARAEQGNRRLGGSVRDLNTGLVSLSSRLPLVKWGTYAAGAAAALPPTIALAGALGPLTGLLGAIPGLAAAAGGSLVTGMLGMRGVGDAVGAAWDQQLSAATDATAAAQQSESAIEAVQAAEERLSDAHRSARRAQDDVNEAREEATQRLEDMRIEAERASLAERGSALSLKQARQELARLEAEPAGDDPAVRSLALMDARQRVAEAEADLEDTRRDGARAQREYTEAEDQGLRRMPEVVEARQRLAEANRDVKSASRDVERASRDASRAMGEGAGGAQALQEKLNDLSPAGRAFVGLIENRFFPLFRRLRDEAQEGLLPGLGRGLIQAERNFPVIERMVGRYGDALGDAAEQQGKLFGSRAQGRDLENIFGQGERLIRRSADASIDWERGLTHVAVAAEPILDWAGKMDIRLARMFNTWARGGRESGRLERFFERATQKAETTIGALWDFGRGLINIGAIGARVWGNDMLRGIGRSADRFRRWTESVRGSRDIEGYFRRWRERWSDISDAMARVIRRYRELRAEGKSVSEAGVQALSEAFSRALPKLAEAAGRAAPHVVEGFVSGFLAADAWGKLFLGGWLLTKLGGGGAARGIGAKLAAGIFAGIAGEGTGGKIFGLLAGRGTTPANPLFVTNVGGVGPGGVAPVPGGGRGAGSTIGRVARGGLAIGAAAIFAPEILQWTRQQKEADDARRATERFNRELGDGGIEAVNKRIRALERNSRQAHRYSGQQKEELEHLRRLRRDYGRHTDELKKVEVGYSRLRRGSDINLRQLRRTSDENWEQISRSMGLHSTEGQRAASRNFRLTLRNLERLKRDGTVSTRQFMREIRRLLDRQSGAGQLALARNFNAAERSIARSMSRGGRLTERGMSFMKEVMGREMKAFGFTQEQVNRSLNLTRAGERRDPLTGKSPETLGGHAGGGILGRPNGWVGRMGERGRDLVHAILGRGEAVLNHVQQRVVNAGLSRLGIGGLPDLFRRTRGARHHMAEGGIAGDGVSIADYMPKFAGGGIAGMTAAANRLDRAEFEYRWGGGHQASPAPFGPMDCSGAVSYVLQAGGVKIPTMVSGALMSAGRPGPGAVTVFANPEHTFMRILGRYFGTSPSNPGGGAGWFPDPGDDYKSRFVQRHFAAGPGGAARLARLLVGPGRGPHPDNIQGAVDIGRGAAQLRLDRFLATSIGDGDPGHGGIPQDQIARLWAQENRGLGDPHLMSAIAMAESSGDPGAHGPPDGRGLYQIEWPIWAKTLARLGNPYNARDNTEMAGEVLRRQGLGAWVVYNTGAYKQYMADGGFAGGDGASIASYFPFAGAFQGGGFVGGGGMLTKKGTRFRDKAFRVIGNINDDIEDLGRRYELDNRRADLTEEEFVIEGDENTPPRLNQEAIDRRMGELNKLIATRRKITMKYARLARYIDKLLRVYQTMRERLGRTVGRVQKQLDGLKGKKGKENARRRKTLGERLDKYEGTLSGVRERIGELGPQLDEARYEHESSGIDLEELRRERQPLLGDGAGIALPGFAPGDSGELGGDDADLQAQLEQRDARIATLEEAGRLMAGAFDVFQGPGDIGAGGRTALAAAANPYSLGGPGPGLNLMLNPQTGQIQTAGGAPIDLAGLGGQQAREPQIVNVIQTLHPADPQTLDAIARASNAGNAQQGAPGISRVRVGP